ncbi:MAG: class I SAM-dependent methyltransferase [Salinivirgaceae bacterium]|jgi:ubiquinone/menaquinone biosynthesis C-methylase UbiE
MKYKDKWKPNKFVYKKGKLRASQDPHEVGIPSRLAADLVAQFYDLHLNKYSNGRLLDLGCGKIPLFEVYKNSVKECICVDWENTTHKNIHIDMFVDLNKPLPFSENEFDTIILSDVLEHIMNPSLLWDEMSRILKPGGVLIMNVPFHYSIHEIPYDYFRYTRFALQNFAQNSNFEIIIIEELGGAIEVLTDFISKIICYIPKIGKLIAILLQKLNWVFLKTTIGQKVLKRTSNTFTIGYGLIARKIH